MASIVGSRAETRAGTAGGTGAAATATGAQLATCVFPRCPLSPFPLRGGSFIETLAPRADPRAERAGQSGKATESGEGGIRRLQPGTRGLKRSKGRPVISSKDGILTPFPQRPCRPLEP